jgi:hypothetical protein
MKDIATSQMGFVSATNVLTHVTAAREQSHAEGFAYAQLLAVAAGGTTLTTPAPGVPVVPPMRATFTWCPYFARSLVGIMQHGQGSRMPSLRRALLMAHVGQY